MRKSKTWAKKLLKRRRTEQKAEKFRKMGRRIQWINPYKFITVGRI